MLPSMVAVMAASAAAAERRHVDAFRVAGATSPERAQPIASLGLARDEVLARLTARGIVREVARGAVYLDETALIALRDRKPPRALLVVALLLGLLGALLAGMQLR